MDCYFGTAFKNLYQNSSLIYCNYFKVSLDISWPNIKVLQAINFQSVKNTFNSWVFSLKFHIFKLVMRLAVVSRQYGWLLCNFMRILYKVSHNSFLLFLSHVADKGCTRTSLKDNKSQRGHPKVMPGLF